MWSSRRKSWNTMPMRRRSVDSASFDSVATSWPNWVIRPARRLEREEQQAQQRGLAGAGGSGEELERMRLDAEREVAQDLGPEPVAQADILESDHSRSPPRFCEPPPGDARRALDARRRAHIPHDSCAFTGLSRRRQRGSGLTFRAGRRGAHGFRSINGRLLACQASL